MYTKHVIYTDFNGNERETDVHFNLNEMEMANFMATIQKSGYDVDKMDGINSKNFGDMLDLMTELMLSAYGVPSDDGMYFRKKDASGKPLYEAFVESAVYPALLDAISESSESMREFIQGLLPKRFMANIKEIAKSAPAGALTDAQKKALADFT